MLRWRVRRIMGCARLFPTFGRSSESNIAILLGDQLWLAGVRRGRRRCGGQLVVGCVGVDPLERAVQAMASGPAESDDGRVETDLRLDHHPGGRLREWCG